MSKLIDIAPQLGERVAVRGAEITVYGLSIQNIASLVLRFPQLAPVFSRQEGAAEKAIAEVGAEVIGALIAAGCREAGPEAEAVAAQLSFADQLALLKPILTQTMPRGPVPFVQELLGLLVDLKVLDPASVPAMEQPAQPPAENASSSKISRGSRARSRR